MTTETELEEVLVEMCLAGAAYRRWDRDVEKWRYYSMNTLSEDQLPPSLGEQKLTS